MFLQETKKVVDVLIKTLITVGSMKNCALPTVNYDVILTVSSNPPKGTFPQEIFCSPGIWIVLDL